MVSFCHLWPVSHMSPTLRSSLLTHFTLSYYYLLGLWHLIILWSNICLLASAAILSRAGIPGAQSSVCKLQVLGKGLVSRYLFWNWTPFVSLQLIHRLFLCSHYSLKRITCGHGRSAFFFVPFQCFSWPKTAFKNADGILWFTWLDPLMDSQWPIE